MLYMAMGRVVLAAGVTSAAFALAATEPVHSAPTSHNQQVAAIAADAAMRQVQLQEGLVPGLVRVTAPRVKCVTSRVPVSYRAKCKLRNPLPTYVALGVPLQLGPDDPAHPYVIRVRLGRSLNVKSVSDTLVFTKR
jgi:hypothetical protein